MVAALAAISVPLYQRQVLRSNRAIAKGVLMDLASRQEAYALQHNAYAVDLSALQGSGHSGATRFFLARNGEKSEGQNSRSIYEIELLEYKATSFELRARAIGVQSGDRDCQSLMLDSRGRRWASAEKNHDDTACWQ